MLQKKITVANLNQDSEFTGWVLTQELRGWSQAFDAAIVSNPDSHIYAQREMVTYDTHICKLYHQLLYIML